MKRRVDVRKIVAQTGIREVNVEITSCGRDKAPDEGDAEMRVWERDGYEVVEKEFDRDLHEFEIIKDGEVVATITPPDLDNMAEIVSQLDAGEDVNGWEDGNGNTIRV